jgi:uncharacterized protein (TIGR02452 family)
MTNENKKATSKFISKVLRHKLILGAYGCGVFGNDPNDVAKCWKELLFDEGYGGYFKRVLFVILDKSGGENIAAFECLFGK